MLSPIDISDAVNNALKNLSDSPTAIIGQSIAEALSVVQTKIHYFSSKKKFQYQQDYIKFLNSAFAKISAIPIVDQIEPQAQILGAISEDITHCVGCEELREMFATLLSNSCNCKYSSIVHPSFSSSLKSMSPYDAMFLKKINEGQKNTDNIYEAIEAAEYILFRSIDTHEDIRPGMALPAHKNITIFHECIVFTDDYFSDFDMQSLSISALKQLGIIGYTQSEPFSADRKFTEIGYFKSLKKQYNTPQSHVEARRLQMYLTPYGQAFINACLTPPLLSECNP